MNSFIQKKKEITLKTNNVVNISTLVLNKTGFKIPIVAENKSAGNSLFD
ncbi:MAG: hypothetical protein ACJ0QL_07815 [Parvicellaceae bacterium]